MMTDTARRPTGLVVAPLVLGAFVLGALTAAGSPAHAGAQPTARAPRASGPQERCAVDPVAAARVGGVQRDQSLSSARVRAYEDDLARRLGMPDRTAPRALRREARQRSAATKRVTVRVRAHVIKPRKGKHVLSRKKVRRQIRIMNRAYHGRQARRAFNTRIRFRLKGIDYTVRHGWYRAGIGTRGSRRMRTRLHRGGRGTLNIYFASPSGYYGQVLGYSTFPQKVRRHPKLDGVVVNVSTLKGSGPKHYRKGDTGVHETGHWLGLYHTFQGGCGKRNDRVTDTQREQSPNFRCPRRRNTCRAPGLDPVHNFMDYSYDHCMNRFTRGQAERMKLHWLAYRD